MSSRGGGGGGPFDIQRIRRVSALRRFLVLRTASALAGAVLTVAQVLVVARAITGGPVSRALLATAAAVLAGRCTLAWSDRWSAETAAARWKRQLRLDATQAVREAGVRGDMSAGSLTTLLTHGVDSVDGYVTGPLAALPDAMVSPLVILAALFVLDWPSALVVLVTLPFVPALLALVGLYTQARARHRLQAMLRLGTQFSEAVSGLVTLRLLGRQEHTAVQVRTSAEEHGRITMRVLRLAFLSSFVLETLTSLSVALIAVPVGFRLLDGAMSLESGLAVLLLTPEAYRALRVLGTQFHAAQDTHAVLDQLEGLSRDAARPAPAPARTRPPGPAPDPADGTLTLHDLAVGYDSPVLTGVSMELLPGRRYVLTGPSGAGKSTLLRTVAGVLPPLAGHIRSGAVNLGDVDPDSWTRRLAMVPQRPHLFHGTVADNLRVARPDAARDRMWHALEQAGAADFVRRLPDGLDAPVGDRAARLSAGERQRLALARALLREPSFLLLDEPTARLDGESEERVLGALQRLAGSVTLLVVTHRPAVAEAADALIEVGGGRAVLAGDTSRTGAR
ncbi:thiol reductant ABC exporter subunit CydD [Streptomyces gilvus]|uniref:thiol reductant ABC exporter subunit CydD n=1 Tax=Streptomyces gilvus TaxID=2920937 RepID=UPI001F0FE4F4|nr:thiol reductant ABC exporter subunit CydD [Streptomyces sp. CME 23]MCH5670869.1 thiol reductant ABC exporter subunit CydD [Streptomyces sp. CME 23]